MLDENISLSGEEAGMMPPGETMFYENGVGSPDPNAHSAATTTAHNPMPPSMEYPDFADAAEGILPATEEELLMEEEEMMRLREKEMMMATQNIVIDPPANDVPPPSHMSPFAEPHAPAFSASSHPNSMPSPVPNPNLKSALFTSPPPKAEGEQTPLKEKIFAELDEENQHPNDANAMAGGAPTLLTAKSPNSKSPGLKNATQPVFASPTPSDKEAGLD